MTYQFIDNTKPFSIAILNQNFESIPLPTLPKTKLKNYVWWIKIEKWKHTFLANQKSFRFAADSK